MSEHGVEMSGWISAKKEVQTLKDLRDLVAWCDENKINDDAVLDYGSGPYLYVDFLGDDVVQASWIQCGDHGPSDPHFDILVETHHHDDHEQPAMFDWPSKDRAKRSGAYHRTATDYCHDNGHSYADDEDICYVCGAVA